MKIYSPSQTMLFDRCRWKWYLSKRVGVEVTHLGKRDLAAAYGSAVGGTLAVYYKQRGTGDIIPLDVLAPMAVKHYYDRIEQEIINGREATGLKEEITYPELIPRQLATYFDNPGIEPTWSVLGTEALCGDDNKAYIDAYGMCDLGVWVLDWKCKMFCRPNDMEREMLKYQRSWQFSHYIWSLHRKLGEWPKFSRVNMLFATPKTVSQWMDFTVDHEYFYWWEKSAMRIWADMEATEEALDNGHSFDVTHPALGGIVPMATNHFEGIFKCELTDLCFLYRGDVESTSEFIQVKK